MAKIKLGAIVVDMSGKLGGHVFAKNKGGNYMRTKTTPLNPQTAAQSEIRSIFATVSSGWSALTDVNRESFKSSVEAYAKTNVFGDLKSPTAKALYQRLNTNLAYTSQTVLTTCLAPAVVVSPLLTAAGGAVGAQTLTLTTDGTSVGSKIIISVTPQLSAGTSFIKNKIRVLEIEDGVVGTSFEIGAAYVAKYGAFTVNSNIKVSVVYVNDQGQASPPQSLTFAMVA